MSWMVECYFVDMKRWINVRDTDALMTFSQALERLAVERRRDASMHEHWLYRLWNVHTRRAIFA